MISILYPLHPLKDLRLVPPCRPGYSGFRLAGQPVSLDWLARVPQTNAEDHSTMTRDPFSTINEPELAARYREFEQTLRQVQELAASLTDDQFAWQPSPDRWSIGHCVDHLTMSAEAYVPQVEATLAEARQRGATASGPFRYSAFSGWLVSTMEPPPGRRLPTVARFGPPQGRSRRQILEAYEAANGALTRLIAESDGIDLRRVRVQSPVTRLLRLPLGRAFEFLAAHERRHLWQAEQVRRSSGFPG
jgi:hypothetical protein